MSMPSDPLVGQVASIGRGRHGGEFADDPRWIFFHPPVLKVIRGDLCVPRRNARRRGLWSVDVLGATPPPRAGVLACSLITIPTYLRCSNSSGRCSNFTGRGRTKHKDPMHASPSFFFFETIYLFPRLLDPRSTRTWDCADANMGLCWWDFFFTHGTYIGINPILWMTFNLMKLD